MKRLFSTLVVFTGCLIIAALFGILVVPGLRNANKPATPTGVSPVTGETGWLDEAEYTVQKGRVIPPVDPQTLIRPSEDLTAAGKELYDANCASCHGSLGLGDGPASGIDPPPRNFTAADGWINGSGMPGIYKTLSEGISTTSMASYDYLTKRDRMALVHYVQSLGGYPGREGDAAAMKTLSDELAAPGETTNNRIPVSMAMEKLENEYVRPNPLGISPEDRSAGADLLRGMVTDAYRAAQALQASDSWRTSPEELARSVLASAPGNGFSITAATLKPWQWQALYNELLKRL